MSEPALNPPAVDTWLMTISITSAVMENCTEERLQEAQYNAAVKRHLTSGRLFAKMARYLLFYAIYRKCARVGKLDIAIDKSPLEAYLCFLCLWQSFDN